MANAKRFVYILKSVSDPTAHYVGVTCDVSARLAAHNAGHATYTADNRPWRALVIIEFD